MDNDELKAGQSGPLKEPYLGYRHVEFVEYDYPQVRVRISSAYGSTRWIGMNPINSIILILRI